MIVTIDCHSKSVVEIATVVNFLKNHSHLELAVFRLDQWKKTKLKKFGIDEFFISKKVDLKEKEICLYDEKFVLSSNSSGVGNRIRFWFFNNLLSIDLTPHFNNIDFELDNTTKVFYDILSNDNSGTSPCFLCLNIKSSYSNFFSLLVSKDATSTEFHWKIFLYSAFARIISLVSKKFFSRHKQNRRAFLSLNIGSSEFKNIKRRARLRNFSTLLNSFKIKEYSDFFLYSDEFSHDPIYAIFLDRLSCVPFVYIGLPGARFVTKIVASLKDATTTIHMSHGRVSSKKFMQFTDYVFGEVKQSYNCRYFKFYKEKLNILYKQNRIAWVHGYPKGTSYRTQKLFEDIRQLRTILNQMNRSEQLTVYVHPTASLLKFYLLIFGLIPFKRVKIQELKIHGIHASVIYSSSPTFTLFYKSKFGNTTTGDSIRFYSLR